MPWEELSKWALGALLAVLSLLGLELRSRVKDLEKNRVSSDDLDELRTSMMVTFTHGHNLLEKSLSQQDIERQRQHEQNRALLQRMEQKMDANEERSANTRHATLDQIHTLALSVAVLSRQENDRRKDREKDHD